MEKENKISPHAFNIKTEIIYNLIGGFAGGLVGYWCGAKLGGPWLAYILFFVIGYLGYNFKQTIIVSRPVFTAFLTGFWKTLLMINPHPIITLPVCVYFSAALFAIACDGSASFFDVLGSTDKLWQGIQANLTWKNTGINLFVPESINNDLTVMRVAVFYIVAIISIFFGALVAAPLGWGIKFFVWCVKHPQDVFSALISLYNYIKKTNPYPITTATIQTICCVKIVNFIIAEYIPIHDKTKASVALSLILIFPFIIFWPLTGQAIARVVSFVKALTVMKFKQAMLFLIKLFFLVGFFSTIGLVLAILKALTLTIIGIHSARRLACGISTVYMIFVPFSVETVPTAVLAIGCGLVSATTCALVAVALDGEGAYQRLDAFMKKPIKSFAPNFVQ